MTEQADSIEDNTKGLGHQTRDKIAGGGKRVQQSIGKGWGTLTGRTVEQQVEEYTELYTQVLLGLHDDVQELTRKLEDLSQEMETLKAEQGERGIWRGICRIFGK